MRSPLRAFIVLIAGAALLVLFLSNVDLRGVGRQIVHADPSWLLLALLSMLVNLVLRSWRWQYLLEPIGRPAFQNAFRATTVGFAASTVLPARAGEVIRPTSCPARTRGLARRGRSRQSSSSACSTW